MITEVLIDVHVILYFVICVCIIIYTSKTEKKLKKSMVNTNISIALVNADPDSGDATHPMLLWGTHEHPAAHSQLSVEH